MAVQVFQPFEIFYDINGKPLDDGFIWVGQPNLDPEANQISVFFDEALTIPATQPIRTRNGFPANAGVQAQIFVAETTFSITIKNKNSTVIRSVAAVHSSSDLEGRLRDAVNPLNGAGIVGYEGATLATRLGQTRYATELTDPEVSTLIATAGTHIVIDRDVNVGSQISPASNTKIVFKNGARLIPTVNGGTMINIAGSAPSSFTALSADALTGATSISTALSLAAGDWVEIRSEKLLPSPNDQAVKQGQIVQIRQVVSAGVYRISRALEYDFMTADTATVGKCTMKQNIEIDGAVLNSEDFTFKPVFGFSLLYSVNIRLSNIVVQGTKDKGTGDVSANSAIKVNNCIDVLINNSITRHIGWYGIEVLGAAHNVLVKNHQGFDCRHTVSVNWSMPYGEPTDVLIEDSQSFFSVLAGFDTHDIGKRLRFVRCLSGGSQTDSGFQARSPGTEYYECVAYNNALDGFAGRDGIFGTTLTKCNAYKNGRTGYNYFERGATLMDCSASDNVTSGAALKQGHVLGGTWERNNLCFDCGTSDTTYPQGALVIENINAPQSATQPRLLQFRLTQSRIPELVTLRDSVVHGYGNNLTIASGYDVVNTVPPVMYGNQLTEHSSGSPTSGFVTLVAGTALVSTTAVFFNNPVSGSALKTMPKIRLTMVAPGGTVGAVFIQTITNVTSFRVTSTSNTDTSIYKWELEY